MEFNHKAAILWLLKYHFKNEPINITRTYSSDILYPYKKQIKQNQNKSILLNIKQCLSLNDIQKTAILECADSNKLMKILAEKYEKIIKNTPLHIQEKILELSLTDIDFIQKCNYYKNLINFVKKKYNTDDIKSLISKTIMLYKNDDLTFYNNLLEYGQNEIEESYIPKKITANKKLKKLLDKCGYKITNKIGKRYYELDSNVKKYHEYIQ